jgi:hypothetical protein
MPKINRRGKSPPNRRKEMKSTLHHKRKEINIYRKGKLHHIATVTKNDIEQLRYNFPDDCYVKSERISTPLFFLRKNAFNRKFI